MYNPNALLLGPKIFVLGKYDAKMKALYTHHSLNFYLVHSNINDQNGPEKMHVKWGILDASTLLYWLITITQ